MKVLWFANTPCGASNILNFNLPLGGWLISLEKQLVECSEIDLNICFYWGKRISPFSLNNTNYYPVYREEQNSKLSRLLSRITKRNKDIYELEQLKSIIKLVAPDIIHIHGTEENFGLIQRFSEKPTVISIQGLLNPLYNKYFSGIPKNIALRYEKISSKLLFNSVAILIKSLQSNAVREKEILAMSKYIIGRTTWDKRLTGFLAPQSTYFIGNEILRDVFYDTFWNKNAFESELRLVSIISPGLYKGLETLVKTARLLNEHKLFKFRWTIIGQNEDSNISNIVKKWTNTNYKHLNIEFLGVQSDTKIANLLLNSDIYCQISHIENSPNSLCEAMLIGMPIIASYAGGTESMLTNNKDGLLVQSGDCYSFASSIYDYYLNFEKAKELGQNARLRSMKRHNKQTITEDTLNVYNNIISL